MRLFILLFSLFNISLINAQVSKIKFTQPQKYFNSQNYFILGGNESEVFVAKESTSSTYIQKVNLSNMEASEFKRINLEWNNDDHELIKALMLGDDFCIYTRHFDIIYKETHTFLHKFNTRTMTLSDPVKIATYNTPKESNYDLPKPDEKATRVFSENLIQLVNSPAGQYAFTLSCKDKIGNVAHDSKKEQKERIFEAHLYNNSIENSIVSTFKPPNPNFFIFDMQVDFDGTVYILGRTLILDYNIGRPSWQQEILGVNDLQLIRLNPETGETKSDIVETDDYYITDFDMFVDGNKVHLTGVMEDVKINTSHIFYKIYDENLNLEHNFNHELEQEFVMKVNSEKDMKSHKVDYEKEYDSPLINYPLLNFESIHGSRMDDGRIVFVMEKQDIVGEGGEYFYLNDDLIIFCLLEEGLLWTKIVPKNELTQPNKRFMRSTFVHSDGSNLHLYYNESEYDGEKNPFAFGFGKSILNPLKVKHLSINNAGEMKTEDDIELVGKKDQLFIAPTFCQEPVPGIVVFWMINKSEHSLGKLTYQ